MSPRIIILVVGGLISVGLALTIWITAQPASSPTLDNATPATVAAPEAQRRERAEKFLGGNPNLDVRGGQEMRPRW